MHPTPTPLLFLTAAFVLPAVFSVGVAAGAGGGERHSDMRITTLAFGSCNRIAPSLFTLPPDELAEASPQPAWGNIAGLGAQLWIWTGDAVYAAGLSVSRLTSALKLQRSHPHYAAFLASRPPLSSGAPLEVIGTWDDHDFGINDIGGEETIFSDDVHVSRDERARAYLDFLGTPDDSPARARTGVYSSATYGAAPSQLKAILLDTRTFRRLHAIPSIGPLGRRVPVIGPFFAQFSTLTRFASALLGLGVWHPDGAILGEEQWAWLEKELQQSQASVHVIVSSVQVFTQNPFVESWGHFPRERERLVALLRKYNPKGLVVVSGDVHYAEALSFDASTSSFTPLEVTSSGLTHTCAGGFVDHFLCSLIIDNFSRGRVPSPEASYLGLNFGSMSIDWDSVPTGREQECAPAFSINIHDAVSGKPVLQYQRQACEANPISRDPLPLLASGWQAWAWRIFFLSTALGALFLFFRIVLSREARREVKNKKQ